LRPLRRRIKKLSLGFKKGPFPEELLDWALGWDRVKGVPINLGGRNFLIPKTFQKGSFHTGTLILGLPISN